MRRSADTEEEQGAGKVFWRRQAHGQLTGIVTEITGYRENGVRLRGAVEMASLVVPLVILAFAGAAVWFSRPKSKHGLHPGE